MLKVGVNYLAEIKFPKIINEIELDINCNHLLNLNIHKRGLFSKRLTQDNLLSWSKESITKINQRVYSSDKFESLQLRDSTCINP